MAGIFNSGFFDYDSSWAFTRLSDARNGCSAQGDEIAVIEFKIDDIYQAARVADELEQGRRGRIHVDHA